MLTTLSNWRSNEKGGLLVATALLLPVLMGFASLALDVAAWRSTKQRMQIGTDAAAIAGAYILREDDYTVADIEAVVAESMAMSGLAHDTNTQTQVAVTEGGQAVQVTMSQPIDMFLSSTFLSEAPQVSVVSEARLVTNSEPVCIVALDPLMKAALALRSGSIIDAEACKIRVNSAAKDAMWVVKGSTLTSSGTCVTGGVKDDGGTITPAVETGCSPIEDPLAHLVAPEVGACDHTGVSIDGGEVTLSPGVYCGGIIVDGAASVHLEPGLYVLKDEGLQVWGGSSVDGTDVTFYLTGVSAGAMSGIDVKLDSTLNLSAASSGALAGILFFEDRDMTPRKHKIAVGSDVIVGGKIYLPRSELFFVGGSTAEVQNPFEMVVANNVKLNTSSVVSFKGGKAEDVGEDGFKVALSK